MTLPQSYQHGWRGSATLISSELDRAHSTVQSLGDALETGDTRSARRPYDSARRALKSVADEVRTLRDEQPPTKDLEEPVATGSTLAIRSASAATVGLDVLVRSMVALAATEDTTTAAWRFGLPPDVDATDVLVGACIDAEQVYEDSAAIVSAASRSHGSELLKLKRAFNAEREVALRSRVVAARAWLRHKCRSGAL